MISRLFQPLALGLAVLGTQLVERTLAVDLPGVQADGSVLLPNQWSLRPVGKQTLVGDFPVNIAIHPSGKYAAILHSGYGPNELVCIAVPDGRILSRSTLPESFYGLSFSSDGNEIFCSGAGDEVIHRYRFAEGHFSEPRDLRLRDEKQRGVSAGLAVSRDGRRLWSTELYGQEVVEYHRDSDKVVARIPLAENTRPADLDKTKVSANEDLAAAEKRAAAQRETLAPDAPFPYGCVLDETHNRLYVSLWARAQVAVIDLASHTISARWSTEEHPNELLLSRDRKRLFVANANRNTVLMFDTETGRPIETLSAAMSPDEPPGTTPNSLALSPDEDLLFVANAGNNNVAVFDITQPGQSKSMGFIPTGWYPTSVRVSPDGKTLLVANGKGVISKPNRNGPQAGREAPAGVREYIAGLLQGTVSVIPLPAKGEKFIEAMAKHTERAHKCSPKPTGPAATIKRDRQNPIPARVGGKSPIQHVIYVIKENRTYDQVLGDMKEGNGDPSICLFPESITPNHHRIAREFVLLDNFYVDGEVSADGHEWSVGAYATDFVEKSWPLSYGHNGKGKFPYPSEGSFRAAQPSSGYLWDRAKEAGVSYRNYGQFIALGKETNGPAVAKVPSLEGHFDPWFRPWDMDYPDVKRAERFLSELKRFEREGSMPRLQIVRLPNDHTYGTSTGKPTPKAMLGDNDLAFGMLVEGVTRSKFWPTTAIFVLEDDAQNGPDHVDAHRSIAFVISPYTKRHFRDSTMYSTCSMLRSMELILGLKPMTQFDAAAQPMYNSFQPSPNLQPYKAVPVTVDRTERNLASAWGAEKSNQMNFSKEDAADDLVLNEVVWRSIRGANHPMPSPRRAAFVRGGEDDDD